MKILFIPLSENALAHVVRCLVLAQEAERRGHLVLFACTKDKVQFIKNAGFLVYNNGYSPFSSVHKNRLEYFIGLRGYEIKAAKSFKPDVVVSDPVIAGFFASSISDTPLVYITNTTLLPEYGGVYGFSKSANKKDAKKDYFGSEYPRNNLFEGISTVFSELQHKRKLEKYEDLFSGVLKIIPSTRTLDLVKKKSKDIKYVGPLFYSNFEKITPSLMTFVNKKTNLVFVNFGGSVLSKKSYANTLKVMISLGYTVAVATGPNFSVKELKKTIASFFDPNKIFIAKYLPGLYLNSIAKFSFNSGGHGVVVQSLYQGCPMICLPHNVDQATYAQRIEEINCGKNLIPPIHVTNNLNFWAKKSRSISKHQIVIAVKELEAKYVFFKKNALKMQKELNLKKNGSTQALIFIEKFVKSKN